MLCKKCLITVYSFLAIFLLGFLSNQAPGANETYDDQVRAFRKALQANGFIVREGHSHVVYPLTLVDEKTLDSASGNNAGQPYKVLDIPLFPFGEEPPDDRGLATFRLRRYEAIVYVGPTPPPCDYFSFTPFLWVRRAGRIVSKGDWIFAAVGDPLNNALIKTSGKRDPFHKQTIVIFTPDKQVYKRVAALAQAAGYPESIINRYVIPSDLLNLGGRPNSDSLLILVRTANFTNAAQGRNYLNNNSYANIFRVTADPRPTPDPFDTPALRNRIWKSEETLFPDLKNGLNRLKAAILAKTPNVAHKSFESIRWFAESRDVLEEDNPDSPLYHKFVAGEASDTPYRRIAKNGKPANFILGNEHMVVVYGVNHAATGLATYSSFGVYGDWPTGSCQNDPWDYTFGCGDKIWNGVAGMTNHQFRGSAEQYIPGDPMARYLYAVKVLRNPPQDKRDKYWVVVPGVDPQNQCQSPSYCINLADPITIGYRAYLNPATASGPAYEDIIPDRAILFKLQD